MLLTVLAFIVVLGVLIFVHELGHFLAAKAVGIGVSRFSIGFGPATPLRFRRGETEYLVSWIPLGGYVKMASHEEQEAMEALEGGAVEQQFPPEKLFESKPLWARILVISAGVIMNALFAWVAYSALLGIYGRTEDPTTRIAAVRAEGLPPAASALAELPFGAEIERINGQPVASWDAILEAISDPASKTLRFELADRAAPLEVAVPGTDATGRIAIAQALVPLWEPRIGALAAGRPAAAAGLEVGDRILAVDGTPLRAWNDLVALVEGRSGEELTLRIERGGEILEVPVVPAEETIEDPLTREVRKVGRIGIGPQLDLVRSRFGPLAAIVEGARRTGDDAQRVLLTLKGMIFGHISPKELGGPILIAQVSGQVARIGVPALLAFMALLSVNLAILNLLPIPVLDGGHLVFLAIEGLRGKPLSLDLRLRLTQVGLFVLLGIMALALVNDMLRSVG